MIGYPLSVFLDTNIFKNCKYDFDGSGVLNLLKKLVDQNKVKLYLSDIVVRETEKHIKVDIAEAIACFKKASKLTTKTLSTSIVEGTHLAEILELPLQATVEDKAINSFRRYLDVTKAIILDSVGINIDLILNDYFNGQAPFEQKEIKKHEFPDAIIAAKLKIEFSERNPLWIISSDEGFKKTFHEVRGFICLTSLKELFDVINRQDRMYNAVVQYLTDTDSRNLIIEFIKEKLELMDFEVNGLDCDRKGLCEGYEYDETTITNISDIDYELSSVDEIKDTVVSVTLSCKAKILAYCSFDDYENSIWDSEEKEYIFLSTGEVEEEHEPIFECSLELRVSQEDDSIHFNPMNASVDIELDQYSRVSQNFINQEDDELVAKCDMADALEEYYRH